MTFTKPKSRARAGAGTWPARRRAPESRGSAGERDAGGGERSRGTARAKQLFPPPVKTFFIKLLLYSSPTSFWPRKAFVQVEDDFLHKVLYVTVLRAAHEHHPVVGEALHGGFFPHLGAVPQLQLHLHGTLRAAGGETAVNNRKATVRHCTLRLTFFFLLLETHIKGNGGALCIHVYARGRAHPTPDPARGVPGPASTPARVVTECYPQSGRGSGDRGEERAHSATTCTTTNASETN